MWSFAMRKFTTWLKWARIVQLLHVGKCVLLDSPTEHVMPSTSGRRGKGVEGAIRIHKSVFFLHKFILSEEVKLTRKNLK